MEQDPKQAEQATRAPNGRFPKGTSGNPTGAKKRKRELRTDGLVNAWTGQGTSRDRRGSTYHRTRAVHDIAALDLRRGNWLARRICELLPSACFSKAYTLKLPDKELAEKVMSSLESLVANTTMGANAKFVDAGAMERACGGAALMPIIDGATGHLWEPLDLEDPRIIRVNALHLLEPRELMPETWYDDIRHPKFRMPATYRLWPLSGGRLNGSASTVIHESRLAIFPGRRVSAEQMPGQRLGWGDNELTPVEEVIHDFGMSWASASTILQNFSQRVFKFKGLTEILKETNGEALVEKRARTMDMIANVLRAMPLDGEDDLVNITTSISGLADMLVQLAQLVSAAADLPMTKLFGMSPAGMNATGEFDQEGWNDRVENQQTYKYTSPVEWLIRLILLSTDGPTRGKEPDVWSIEWKPLKNQDVLKIAQARKLDAETDHIRIEDGVYTADDAAESRFKGDTYGSDITIDWKRREEQRKLDEQRAEDLENDQAAMEALGRKPPADGESPASGESDPPEPGDDA